MALLVISTYATGKNIPEPHHEKTNILVCKNKGADQLRGNCKAEQHLPFRYRDSTVPLLSKSKISSL